MRLLSMAHFGVELLLLVVVATSCIRMLTCPVVCDAARQPTDPICTTQGSVECERRPSVGNAADCM
jgi:hypothetical protein